MRLPPGTRRCLGLLSCSSPSQPLCDVSPIVAPGLVGGVPSSIFSTTLCLRSSSEIGFGLKKFVKSNTAAMSVESFLPCATPTNPNSPFNKFMRWIRSGDPSSSSMCQTTSRADRNGPNAMFSLVCSPCSPTNASRDSGVEPLLPTCEQRPLLCKSARCCSQARHIAGDKFIEGSGSLECKSWRQSSSAVSPSTVSTPSCDLSEGISRLPS
mmetsp:Transcript_38034/g.75410  ORF Transcript_38034/g.75410 Transcript_38034/m.75410 type:complete len:211 (+) Transcript_38034:923-1555(+)